MVVRLRQLATLLLPLAHGSIPRSPHYFMQLVDHFASPSEPEKLYRQRFYEIDEHFGGPGSPIICIIGGEGAVPPSEGIFYPWVGVELASRFHALVIQPEHRFYGTSNPAGPAPFDRLSLRLLTPQQALADAATLILAKQNENNCTAHGTQNYCPVITVGGSYPGFLSAMMRLRYPAVVDMAYSASAPTLLYAQKVDHTAYYKKITESAARSNPACPAAVRKATAAYLALGSKEATIAGLGLCTAKSSMPQYIATGSLQTLQLAVNMLLMYSFADLNMENYPPNADSKLAKACAALVEQPTVAGLKAFLLQYAGVSEWARAEGSSQAPAVATAMMAGQVSCYNLSTQLPAGHLPTIRWVTPVCILLSFGFSLRLSLLTHIM